MSEAVERLLRLDTCAVSDALDALGMKGATFGVRPMWNCPRIAGRVMPVKIQPVGLTPAREHLGVPAIMASRPGDVIVVDHGGRMDVSAWGGLLSLAAERQGVAGVLVDGACRDVDEYQARQFPVFARGAVPITARGRVMQQAWNVEIQFAGVAVLPGDLVLADHSGIVFIPQSRADIVLEHAEAVFAKEARMAQAIMEGKPLDQVMGGYEGMLKGDGTRG